MNDSEVVDISHAGRDFRELGVIRDMVRIWEKAASGLTNCKRFAFGFAFVYSITFPFCIQSEMTQKLRGSVEMETPNKGRMLG